jgi:hypothetical protein
MGLDSVEFVMAVEEAFQVAIPDDTAEQMRTPGDVVDYVLARVGEAEGRTCLEQRAFYRLRQAAMRTIGVARKVVHPDTRWVDILPSRQLRHNWNLLHHATGLPQWPRLTWRGKLPPEVGTVGLTARYLEAHARAALQGAAPWTRGMVEETVRRLMLERLGIKQFRWDQQFVRDLDVD